MRRLWLWLWLVVVLSLYGGYQRWATRTVSHPPGILVAADPAQTPLGANPPRR